MKIKTTITLLLCLISLNFYTQAQTPETKSANQDKRQTEKKTSYNELLDKLKKGDTGIDYKLLRTAYTETKEYNAYGIDAADKNEMYKAISDKKYKDALKMADVVLETNFVEMNAHFVAFIANRELGKAEKSDFHKKVFYGLINSILDGADGKTAKTAFTVICVPEEYVVLNFLGLRRTSQSLTDENGSKFDILSVVDNETNETSKLYFNIDIVWKGYEKMLKK